MLQDRDLGLAPGLEALQGGRCGLRMGLDGAAQRDGVFHGQLGARADGEMRRMHGIADQDDVLVHPVFAFHGGEAAPDRAVRSEEHTSELQSLMRISYAVLCLKKKKRKTNTNIYQ